jgi:hypothetical protein
MREFQQQQQFYNMPPSSQTATPGTSAVNLVSSTQAHQASTTSATSAGHRQASTGATLKRPQFSNSPKQMILPAGDFATASSSNHKYNNHNHQQHHYHQQQQPQIANSAAYYHRAPLTAQAHSNTGNSNSNNESGRYSVAPVIVSSNPNALASSSPAAAGGSNNNSPFKYSTQLVNRYQPQQQQQSATASNAKSTAHINSLTYHPGQHNNSNRVAAQVGNSGNRYQTVGYHQSHGHHHHGGHHHNHHHHHHHTNLKDIRWPSMGALVDSSEQKQPQHQIRQPVMMMNQEQTARHCSVRTAPATSAAAAAEFRSRCNSKAYFK